MKFPTKRIFQIFFIFGKLTEFMPTFYRGPVFLNISASAGTYTVFFSSVRDQQFREVEQVDQTWIRPPDVCRRPSGLLLFFFDTWHL